jgi:hypothetical protein
MCYCTGWQKRRKIMAGYKRDGATFAPVYGATANLGGKYPTVTRYLTDGSTLTTTFTSKAAAFKFATKTNLESFENGTALDWDALAEAA